MKYYSTYERLEGLLGPYSMAGVILSLSPVSNISLREGRAVPTHYSSNKHRDSCLVPEKYDFEFKVGNAGENQHMAENSRWGQRKEWCVTLFVTDGSQSPRGGTATAA